ncbi:MAG: hypothetical protein JST12_06810 [Armatimonadetes bacterium]|nr:hypothetical protein [Armatimonadota bacterium]MBS1701351.1 hypothetical protein [Armatimonadota bacterium]MBS1728403.1 hypothetical protein [Armatimonadota bacterium]
MNENLKKGLLIAAVILLVGFAGWQIAKSVGSDTPHVEAEAKVEPGHKSEKELALEAQQQGKTTTPQPADSKSEADKEAALAGG